jgi:hypothetical protein
MDWADPIFLTALLPIAALVLISSTARALYFELFEKHFRLTFADAPVWSLLYFIGWSLVILFLFPAQVTALVRGVSAFEYLFVAVMLLGVYPGLYHETRTHGESPEWLLALFPRQGMLTLGERYILSKIADVVFQQLIAGVMILTLVDAGVPYPAIVWVFVSLFAAAHLYIFRTAGFMWGLHYTAYATLGGFAIPFFILYVPGGIAYTILFHMLFYVMSGIFFAKLPRPSAHIAHELVGARI